MISFRGARGGRKHRTETYGSICDARCRRTFSTDPLWSARLGTITMCWLGADRWKVPSDCSVGEQIAVSNEPTLGFRAGYCCLGFRGHLAQRPWVRTCLTEGLLI